jgi:predicted transcriptional regulator
MADLHMRKAAGYSGHSDDVWINFRSGEPIGISADRSVTLRLLEKVERLKSLMLNPANDRVDEPLEDVLRDISALALMAVVIREEERAERQLAKFGRGEGPG